MIKTVKIKLRTVQHIRLPAVNDDGLLPEETEDPAPFVTEIESEGELEYGGGIINLTYSESEATGIENCLTTLSFTGDDPGCVTLYRTGEIKTVLIFRTGQRYISVYETEFGSFEVGIYTERCENGITEDGGELSVSYSVEIRGSEAEHTELYMKVEVQK